MSKFCPEAFRKACGDSGPLSLLAVEPKGDEASFAFAHQPFAIAGRNEVSDVILKDPRVSRRHAYFQILNGAVFCVDLKSSCGTRWQEGARFAGWLPPERSVQLGRCTLRLLGEPGDANPFQAVNPIAAGCLEKPILTLEFLNRQKNHVGWPVDRLLTLLGTFAGCKIRFHDPHVSPVHASLVCTADGAWIVDLLSETGTYVNGQKIRVARLEDKDEVRIGKHAMRVHCRPGMDFTGRFFSTTSQLGSAETSSALWQNAARVVQNGAAKNGHGVGMELNLDAREFTLEAALQNPQALKGMIESSERTVLETVFFPLVQQQMSILQNEMRDQFQQAIALMFQMFCTLRNEQIDLLRNEMDQIQSLTREIQALQLELKAQPEMRSIDGPTLESVAERDVKPDIRSIEGPSLESVAAHDVASELPPVAALWPESIAERDEQSEIQAIECPTPDAVPINGMSSESVVEHNGQHVTLPDDDAPFDEAAPVEPSQPVQSAERLAALSPPEKRAEVHDLLFKRMAVLQEDRRSRIQRIVDFLSGKR